MVSADGARRSRPGVERRRSCKCPLSRPQPRPGVLDIEAYVPGKSSAPGVAKVYKLSSNETPLGPSPRAVEGLSRGGDRLHDYPDGTVRTLREAIGRAFGLDPARIVCGAGSDDLINLLGARVSRRRRRGDLHHARFPDLSDLRLSAPARKPVSPRSATTRPTSTPILRAVTPRTKIVFIANPNNPTGTYVPFDEVRRLHPRTAAACAARARRGLCRICSGATTTRPASSWWRPRRMW